MTNAGTSLEMALKGFRVTADFGGRVEGLLPKIGRRCLCFLSLANCRVIVPPECLLPLDIPRKGEQKAHQLLTIFMITRVTTR
jgi:hypothetical protein